MAKKLTDEERAQRQAAKDKEQADRRARREKEAAERQRKQDEDRRARERRAEIERERKATNDRVAAETKANNDRIKARQKAFDAEMKAQRAASDRRAREAKKASDKRMREIDAESAKQKRNEQALLKEGQKMRERWEKEDAAFKDKQRKEREAKDKKAAKDAADEALRQEKVRNKIAQNAMQLVDDKHTSSATKLAGVVAKQYKGDIGASSKFKPSAGSQLSSMLGGPGGIDALGPLPMLKEAGRDWGDLVANTEMAETPKFTVPKSKQSFINRITGGRWDRPRAPTPPGGGEPPDNRGFFRRRKDNWDDRVDRWSGTRDSLVDAHKMGTTDKLFEALKGNIMPAAVGGGVMAATAGLGALGGALALVKKAFFTTWEYIDTKVLPTQSMLNRALGTSTAGMKGLRGEAMSTGLEFERLGLGFEHGAQTVKDIAVAFKSADISKSGMKTLVTAAEYTGIGGENAGSMARSFQAAGMSIADLGDAFKSAQVAAEEFDVPVALIQKEFGENRDALARWGAENSLQFNRAIARAQHYGLSINDLENSFGEAMDSFEASSDVAAKINQTFGTNLDSIRLMNASDEERMEMVQKAIKQTGFVASSQTKYYNNLIKSTLGLKGADDVLRMFGKGATSKDAQKRIDEQAALARGTAAWNKGLSSLGTQLTSIEQLTRKFFMAIGNVVARLLGFESGIDATKSGVKAFETFVDTLSEKINNFASQIPADGKGGALAQFFKDTTNFVSNFNTTLNGTIDMLEDIRAFGTNGEASSLSDRIAEAISKNDDAALAKLNTEVNTPNVFAPNQMKATFHKAARKAHMSENEVLTKMQTGLFHQTYGKPVDVFPQGQGPLKDLPPMPTIVNIFRVDSKDVATTLVKPR